MQLSLQHPSRIQCATIGLLAWPSITLAGGATNPLQASAVASPAAAVPASEDGGWAPYPEGSVTPTAVSEVISAGGCNYQQANDNPHESSGDASVHGWWLDVGGSCPSEANVDVYLQGYWCDPFGCSWITVDSGSGDYAPGGGRGKRATARHACAGSDEVGYRGLTDVDLPGISDPGGTTASTIVNLKCVPA